MAILMPAEDFENFAESRLYFQLTLGRKLMDLEHYHDYYELICVVSGSCTHKVNGFEHIQSAGEVVVLRPGDTHCFLNQAQRTSILSVSFFREIAEPFFRAYMLTDLDDTTDPPTFTLTTSELMNEKRLGEKLFAMPRCDSERLIRVLIGQFLSALTQRRGIVDHTVGEPPESLRQALEAMNELEAAAEGMSAFLRLSNFSHAQLCRLTKKYLGKTPSEVIFEIRMRYAWEMVTGGELDCETVSETVGFKSYSHFCSVFARVYGKPPSAARRDASGSPQTV